MNEIFQLHDKLALVTGASRGIGEATAKLLAAQGVMVIGTATSENGVQKINQMLTEIGAKGSGMVLDVSNGDSIEALFHQIKNEYSMPDILVNNAGITRDNIMLRMKEDEWDAIIRTNLSSIYRMTKACLKAMVKKRWGRIINLSSVSGVAGSPGQSNYAAAKAGMIGFSKSLAKEVATRGITVNCVAPGFTGSDMTDALPDDIKARILTEIPMARIAEPAEIAAAIAFLASPAASYITGETIHANGGMYMV